MTAIEQVRTLIGPENSDFFTDEQVQVFLDLQSGSILLGAALALDSAAARVDVTPHQVSIGKFEYSAGRAQLKPLREQAKVFRDLEYNTPAFAVIEDNSCGFNELLLIRNYVLRNTQML